MREKKHIVLLGDSVFDNKSYVGNGKSVSEHLSASLADTGEVTLLAVDGDRIADVHRQLSRIPPAATHLALSVGGNDALEHTGFLEERSSSVAEVLLRLRELADRFESSYRTLLAALAGHGKPVTVCTIYNSNFPDPLLKKIADSALVHFDDAIIRSAFTFGLPVIDLRLICTEPADYANSIEPSDQGGGKITRAIMERIH